jgi:hypothetical protein
MKIVVKEIKANRGNCICSFWPLEHHKFGDELSVDSFSCHHCQLQIMGMLCQWQWLASQ